MFDGYSQITAGYLHLFAMVRWNILDSPNHKWNLVHFYRRASAKPKGTINATALRAIFSPLIMVVIFTGAVVKPLELDLSTLKRIAFCEIHSRHSLANPRDVFWECLQLNWVAGLLRMSSAHVKKTCNKARLVNKKSAEVKYRGNTTATTRF